MSWESSRADDCPQSSAARPAHLSKDTPLNTAAIRTCAYLAIGLLASTFGQRSLAQVVVMGNAQSGAFVVVVNRKDPRATAAQAASQRSPGDGWKMLLASTVLGHGAMFCVKINGSMQFYPAEGLETGRAAVAAAKDKALSAAAGSGQMVSWCGSWDNTNRFPLNPPSGRRSLTRDYDGVVVTYTMGTTPSGKHVVHVKAKNTLANKSATVRFVGGVGAAGELIVLQPGAGFSMPLGYIKEFDVEVGLLEPDREVPSLGKRVFDAVKVKIREHITCDSNDADYCQMGVRG